MKLTVETREEEVSVGGTHMRSRCERGVKSEANELLGETLRVKFSGCERLLRERLAVHEQIQRLVDAHQLELRLCCRLRMLLCRGGLCGCGCVRVCVRVPSEKGAQAVEAQAHEAARGLQDGNAVADAQAVRARQVVQRDERRAARAVRGAHDERRLELEAREHREMQHASCVLRERSARTHSGLLCGERGGSACRMRLGGCLRTGC